MHVMKRNIFKNIGVGMVLSAVLSVANLSSGQTLSPAEIRAQAGALSEVVLMDVSMPLFRAVKTVHNRKQSFPWGLPQVEQLRPGLLGDDQLDAQERQLLAEFQKPLFHVRLVALKSPIFAPPDLVLAGTFTEEARAELAKLAPLSGRAQLALWLDGGTAGWTKVVAYARQGDEQREEIIDVLVDILTEAARASNLENEFKPFRDRLNGLHNVASMQKGDDNTFARLTLLRTAAELVHDSGRNGIPLFLINWIKRSDEEAVAHLLPPALLATLRELAETKPFPWGEAEAERIAALVQTEGNSDAQLSFVVKALLKPKFRLHFVARTPVSGAHDVLDLEGSFAPGTTAALRRLLPADEPKAK